MNSRTIVLGMLVAVLATGWAWGIDTTGWCGSVTGTPVIVCDDFDDYCVDGYPCDDGIGDDTANQAAFLAVWPGDGCHTDPEIPPEQAINALVISANTCGEYDLTDPDCIPWLGTCVGTEQCGVSGPFALRQNRSLYYPDPLDGYIFDGTSHRHNMVPRIQALDPLKGSVNGTDNDPLVLEYVLDGFGDSTHDYWTAQANRYIEITDGSDRAPIPNLHYDLCMQDKVRPHADRDDGLDHAALAVGILAIIDCGDTCDMGPCGPGGEIRPVTYRLSMYDGDRWIELKYDADTVANMPVPPSPPKGMLLGGHLNYITMTIKSTTIEVELSCMHDGMLLETSAVANRMYTGGFAAMHVGNSACLPGIADADYPRDDYVDNISLTGGVLEDPIPTGACCFLDGSCQDDTTQDGCLKRLGGLQYAGDESTCATANCPEPPGACCVNEPTEDEDFCTEVTLSECNTLGGTYHGAYTSCSDPTIICCPTPFADADGDGDVDQDDFAEFQQCFTGDEGGIPAGCECFNRDDFEDVIKDIDIDDYAQFQNCATGPSIPFEPGNPPASCTP